MILNKKKSTSSNQGFQEIAPRKNISEMEAKIWNRNESSDAINPKSVTNIQDVEK